MIAKLLIEHITGSAVGLGLVLARTLLELHLAEVHDGASRLVQTRLFLVAKAEYNKRFLSKPFINQPISQTANQSIS